MSDARTPGRWMHRALTAALLVLGVVVMALLYALVSQNVFSRGGASARDAASQSVSSSAPASTPAPRTPTNVSDPAVEAVPSGEIIQVGVRNGCGEPGLAAELRGYLVRHDFDVVEVGNYSSFDLDSSLVVDRVGNLRAARRVAAALGIPRRRVRQDISSEYYLDASVLIGSDYRTLAPFRNDDEFAR